MEGGAATNIVASMVQTRSIERVLAPIAAQVSQLIILNDSAEREGGKLPNLVPFAQQVLRATEDLGQVGQTLVQQSRDEVLCSEMPKACDRMKSTGRNVLMAVQRLQAEPHSEEAKENMVTAARRLLQATVKVLLVSDGAEVRRIIQAARYVLDRLRLVKSVDSMKALVTSFKAFTESVMMLSSLCDRRQQDLTQPLSKEQILVAMDSLRKSVPTLSAAMQTSVKYLNNPQAKASRDYVINQVSSTVSDLISLMERQLEDGLSASRDKEKDDDEGDRKEEAGHFASNLDKLIRLLSPKHRSSLDPDFYGNLEDVVRHSMAVGSLSRENLQEQIISSCKQILKQRSVIHDQSEGISDNPDFKQLRSDYARTCECLAKELLVLEKLVKYAVLGLTVDAFVETSEPLDRMIKAATLTLKEKGPLREKDCNRILQPLEETFHEHADRMCQLGSFIAVSCTDVSQANALLLIVRSLERLDPEVLPACLAVRQDILDKGAVQHLKLIRREWQNEVHRLVEAVNEHIDANRFMEISESYIEDDLKECQQAEVITDRDLLAEAANNLLGRVKRVLQVAYNQVEASDEPIFRNGLKVHISQLEQANSLIKNAAQKALSHFQHKRAHQQLTERGLHLLECVHKVGQAVIGRDHPDILNPLRESVRSGSTAKAEDFPTYDDEGRTSPRRLRFSKESFLSKPLPASAGVLDSDPNLTLEDEMSTLKLKHSPATKKKVKPLKLSYPMAGLVRALFTPDQDPRRVGRLCIEAENKSSFLACLAAKASDFTGDSQLKGKIDTQVLQLISHTSTLTEQSKLAVSGTDSAKMDVNLLAEAWTSLVIDIGSALKEMIGCWGQPGNSLMEASLGGATESLPREIDALNLHVQKVCHLVQGITEATQAGFNLNQSKMSASSTQIQLLHKEASDWTKLTHSLISAANETVINPGEPVLEDLIARRWLDWSVKQRQLISIIDDYNMEMSHVTSFLETVAMEGSHDEVTEHVQRVKDYALKIGHMVNTIASCTSDLACHDSLQEGSESVTRLTNLLSEAVVSCSRVQTDEPSSERKNRSLQRVALLRREWSAKAQLQLILIDQIVGEMTIPLDRLSGAAMAVSQASGPSRLELLDEFQTQSDYLTSTVSGIRQACAVALKSAQAGPLKIAVFAAVDALCRLTPIAVTQARNLADNVVMTRADVGSVKREWACNARAVIAGLNDIPDALSSAVKDVTTALRCSKQMPASIFHSAGSAYEESLKPLDTTGLSPLQLNLLQTLPKQGTTPGFAPRHHSTPTALTSGLRSSPASPSRLPQWRASLRASSSSRHSSPGGHPRETNEDEQDGTKKTWTLKEVEDQRSMYRTRSLGLQELQKTPVQRSATSTPTFSTPKMENEASFLNHTYSKCSTSIAAAALVLQREVEKWEDETNSIVRVAKTISAQMYDMARFSRRVNDQAAKDEMINTSKAIAANGRVIFRFAEIISKYCLNERVGSDLRYCAENIPSLCTQLSIIASVKTATPNDDTTDIILMKNADNLMQAVLNTLKATEAACVKGLRPAPGGNRDEEEATALAMQWRLKLDHHRQQEASSYSEVDALGLRRLSRNSSAPALSQILIPR
ncbi:uncharacterized protein LOC117294992 isoform X1 [Asterias rubens]|uniref:uncharacterized protein LOC117294992 isoform X1 n=1 Tax=Asterias rubens TaxID=7604 RepID=UPI001455D48B|nr:uncharacterized protein LOC117294992 isoform X1 [Asterias rubens]